jgi:serine/threonine protein kinase
MGQNTSDPSAALIRSSSYFPQMKHVVIHDALNGGLTSTFHGTYYGQPCVVKFYDDYVPDNNETQIMDYMQVYSEHANWYHLPYFSVKPPKRNITIQTKAGITYELEDVPRIICYSYIEGKVATDVNNELKDDIHEHLEDLHHHGFVHGDVALRNIIYSRTPVYGKSKRKNRSRLSIIRR